LTFDLETGAHCLWGQPSTNFGVYGTFRSRLMGQHLSNAPRDIATLTFDLRVMALVGLRAPSVYQVELYRPFRSEDMTDFR